MQPIVARVFREILEKNTILNEHPVSSGTSPYFSLLRSVTQFQHGPQLQPQPCLFLFFIIINYSKNFYKLLCVYLYSCRFYGINNLIKGQHLLERDNSISLSVCLYDVRFIELRVSLLVTSSLTPSPPPQKLL